MLSAVKRVATLVAFCGLSLALISSVPPSEAQQPGSGTESIAINASAPTTPLPHFWEQVFGSGRAALSLRDSYRRDIRMVKQATNFEYVRFHAIFHDELGIYDENEKGQAVYNFSYVDQIYDGLLENGVRPFVELSFMPRKLAANLSPHFFWYKPFPSPPNNPAKWEALIGAFTNHLIDRYGKGEVEQWYFEVWNEPNIDFWTGRPAQQTYFDLYDRTARAVKRADSNLRIGGPSTAQAAWTGDFIAHCAKNHVPFDFVSTHAYGNDTAQNLFDKDLKIPRRSMVARAAKKVHDEVAASPAPNTPIIWSEYNATYMNQQEVTDSAFMGPWLANNIRESDGLANIMAYWSFSDVFEEMGIVKTPFYGGYGIVGERGIPKAAFRAFELLHRLGDRRIHIDSENALATLRADGTLVVALWNYAEPGESVPPKSFKLSVPGTQDRHYLMQMVSPTSGSALKAFEDMDSPKTPSLEQIRKLIEASQLAPATQGSLNEAITLGPQTLAVLEIR